jgi:HSP20 family protein
MENNGKTTQLAVRRWSPLAELQELREQMRSMFDWRPFTPRFTALTTPREPAVDMFERDGNVVVKAEVPGIPADKVEVTVSDGELRISGERSEEKEVKEENYYRSERSYGHIYRALALPEGCDADKATATVKDGVVEVVIPKKAAAIGKKIEVKAA